MRSKRGMRKGMLEMARRGTTYCDPCRIHAMASRVTNLFGAATGTESSLLWEYDPRGHKEP